MSVSSSITAVSTPQPRRWTRDEYRQLASLGLFEGERVELIDGEILAMSPQEALHFATLARLQKVLDRAFGTGY